MKYKTTEENPELSKGGEILEDTKKVLLHTYDEIINLRLDLIEESLKVIREAQCKRDCLLCENDD